MNSKAAIAALTLTIIAVAAIVMIIVSAISPKEEQVSSASLCKGTALCISGNVTKIVDGDTLEIENITIRLALVNTPEIGEEGYSDAKQFVSALCPPRSAAIADEDDGQTQGSHGRMIAKVSCGGKILNEEVLSAGLAEILTEFCSVSEFATENWAKKYC